MELLMHLLLIDIVLIGHQRSCFTNLVFGGFEKKMLKLTSKVNVFPFQLLAN